MNDWERLHRQAERYKQSYPPGTRVMLLNMNDPYSPVESGMRGTVQSVDDIGQLLMKWDNGRALALIPGEDSFRRLTQEEIDRYMKFLKEVCPDIPVFAISAKEEKGITELEEQIKDMFFGGEISFNDEVYITNARHKAALEEAKESLRLVKESINMGMAEDFFSIDLMSAYESLGRIVGESVGEDLVNEIFSKFCVGK